MSDLRIHWLKSRPGFFYDVEAGLKTFEIRRADRDFRVDDYLVLRPWIGGVWLPGIEVVRITYIVRDFEGLAAGYLALAIARCSGAEDVEVIIRAWQAGETL